MREWIEDAAMLVGAAVFIVGVSAGSSGVAALVLAWRAVQ